MPDLFKYNPVPTGTYRERSYGGKKQGFPTFDAGKPKADGSGYGAYIDGGTGEYWNGPVGTGYAKQGVFTTTAPTATGNNPAQPKFDTIKTVKQPEVAASVTDLLKQQAAQQAGLGPNISTTLTQANSALDRSYAGATAANDTSKIESQLTGSMAGQEAAQRSYTDQQGARNIDYQKQTGQLLDKLTNQLDAGEAAAKATADAAAARGVAASNIAFAGNPDTAGTNSGARSNRAIQAVIQAMLPVTERFAQARYNQTANIEQPLNRELYQNDTGLIAAKSALEAQFGGNWRQIFQYIQGLKQQAAQMNQQAADSFIAQKLNLLGVPAQLLVGQISNLTRLQQLDALANEYTVTTPYDPSRVPPVSTYGVTPPTRSYNPTFSPVPADIRNYGTGAPSAVSNVAPTGYNPADPFWQEVNRLRTNQAQSPIYRPALYSSGTDENGLPIAVNPDVDLTLPRVYG